MSVASGFQLPTNQPALGSYLVRIARLGGYLACAGDPVPGNIVMWRGLARRWLIELYFDAARKLWRVEPRFFKAENLSDAERKSLAAMVDRLRDQRIEQSHTKRGKVGRNQLCPCGSGQKYKRCCGV